MYTYEKMRQSVFTERGAEYITNAMEYLRNKRKTTAGDLISAMGCGDTWERLAVLDYLVEQGRLAFVRKGELTQYDLYRVI